MILMQPDSDRAVEVMSGSTKIDYSSGYRITADLVLTTAHGVRLSELANVRAPRIQRQFDADVAWSGVPNHDLALLRLRQAHDEHVAPVICGEIQSSAGQVDFRAIGFPAADLHGKRRESRQIDGTVQLGSNIKKPALLSLNITSAPPSEDIPGDPWKGISGAGVFTVEDELLVGILSQRLTSAGIRTLEAVRLSDINDESFWNLLKQRAMPHTLWIVGPRLPSIESHRQFTARLTSFKQNLTTDHIPFVNPGEGHPAAPAMLFERLQGGSGERGILIRGSAGSGKTRTCFEVAELAHSNGWAVLHVLPGEPLATNEALTEAIFRHSTPVLVIIDYLNECRGLDLRGIRERILPDAKRRGIPVALIASARPAWHKRPSSKVHQLFDTVSLREDGEYLSAVSRHVVKHAAPNAVQNLGERLYDLCGRRPIIALLIAQEVERRTTAGAGFSIQNGLRAGELLGWLEQRLSEDNLAILEESHSILAPEPHSELQACAAAVASCPQPRADLEHAAACVLRENGVDRSPEYAKRIIDTLLSLRWLEQEHGDSIAVAHDIVCDQLIQNVLLPELGVPVYEQVAENFLSACLGSPRTIGRFSTNLGRLLRDLNFAGDARGLGSYCAEWLVRDSSHIGEILSSDMQEGAYALGNMLKGPPWGETIMSVWDDVAGPWLTSHGQMPHARHLFYAALRQTDADQVANLEKTALYWLDVHGESLKSQHVLSALLGRADLEEEAGRRSVYHAFRWLGRHKQAVEAEFVLRPLLMRRDLSYFETRRAIKHTLRWLDIHGLTHDAQFVLTAALARNFKESRPAIKAHSLRWLNAHSGTFEARFVLRELLRRPDLRPEEKTQILDHTGLWLREYDQTPEARFVLKSALSHDLLPSQLEKILDSTFHWLDAFITTVSAKEVLRPLLRRLDIDAFTVNKTISFADSWLERHGNLMEAHIVLRPLLRREDLEGAEDAHVRQRAYSWLNLHGRSFKAHDVLNPILRTKGLPAEDSEWVITQVFSWLDAHQNSADANFVLFPLLYMESLDSHSRERARRSALIWLKQNSNAEHAELMRDVLHRGSVVPPPWTFSTAPGQVASC
ncbi:serine protease [Streptomyces sp. NPDC002688]|uniref:S1 family peptidase n=1 Tax=Streptomyces sp. NPDC002688 TaxID=3154423 RepID=UPI0033234FA3